MELLGIGPLELLLIVLIAIIIFSPKDLAKGGRTMGRWINRLYHSDTWKSMRQVSQEMQNLPNRLAREAQLEELKDLEKDFRSTGPVPYSNASRTNPLLAAKENADGVDNSPKIKPEKEASPIHSEEKYKVSSSPDDKSHPE
jgi:Sec-independent protein translocase protein TatA